MVEQEYHRLHTLLALFFSLTAISLPYSLTHPYSLSPILSLSLTLSFPYFLSPLLSLSLPYPLSLPYSLSLTLSLTLSPLLSLSLTLSLSLSYSLSLSLSLSLTYTLCPRSPPPPLTVFTLIAKVGGAWEEGRRRGREEVEILEFCCNILSPTSPNSLMDYKSI